MGTLASGSIQFSRETLFEKSYSKMHMWYYFGTLNEKILFAGVNPTNAGQTFAVCLVAFACAVFHEFMKYARQVYLFDPSIRNKSEWAAIFDVKWMLNCAAYFVQMFLSYSLMLLCMYFNVWLVLSVCLGMGVGRLFFGLIPVTGRVTDSAGEENQG